MNRGFACIGLDNPQNPLNVGSAIRAAYCYRVSMLAISGERWGKQLSKIATDTPKGYRTIPTIQTDDLRQVIPFDCVPIAVDMVKGARPLPGYVHPERAFYIFGSENSTLGERMLSWCRDVIYVPTNRCMNLAACVNVVLYDRMAKQQNSNPVDDGARVLASNVAGLPGAVSTLFKE